MDELLREFLTETGETLDLVDVELVRFEQEPNNTGILDNIFRLVHTIKGTCGFLGLPRLEALTHAAEALMGHFRGGRPVTGEAVTLVLATIDRIKALLEELELRQAEPEGNDQDIIAELQRMAAVVALGPAGESRVAAAATPAAADKPAPRQDSGRIASHSIRVHVDTLEHLMTMVSELVLTRNELIEIVRRHADSEFKAPLQRLSNVTVELQEGILKTRMQPIGNAWQKLPRVVRDLSAELGKPIDLEMQGAATELDRQVLDLIKDPLTHMVRNSADHGIEMPAERVAAGKPERGVIRLSACHEGGHITIEVADDGRGLDRERIRSKAIALGLIAEAEIEKLSEAQLQRLIFAPGFSTAESVTSVSGRGVGMDVVRANIDRIGGTIDVKSLPGLGTSFSIKIPLTLAIVSALIVEAAGHRLAIPQLAVIELVRARDGSEHRIEVIRNAPLLRLRNRLLPLVHLRGLLGIGDPGEAATAAGFVVVTQVGTQTFGIVVDRVFHTEEIVVKPMASRLRQIAMFSGTTILGDGSVILILDPNGIVQAVGTADGSRRSGEEERPVERIEEPASEPLLIFRAGSPTPKAVPLSLVTRLEEIDAVTIEMASGRPLVQYRGQLMPLVPAGEAVQIKATGTQPLLVFSDDRRAIGLLVDEIIDIVDERLEIELATSRPGLIGSAVIKGQATEIIDLTHYLPLAFEDWRGWKEGAEHQGPRSVLLVDDTAFFRDLLGPVLRAAGYAVTAADSAQRALTLLEAGRRFDAVVTDLDMPGMDGFELAAALRGNPETAGLPVIGLASLISPEAIERGKRAGLHDCLAKLDRAALVAALREQTVAIGEAA
ncbi:MAG TPA: chemotaxis protein CheW [Xanthobacteraceae bacterium]